jgi:type VI secretion system secreted protein VgrG
MPTYTQDTRTLAVETPLGKDALLLTAFSGVEEMSQLFRFTLDLVSEKESIGGKDIVGKNVTFSVVKPDGSKRHFNGIVQRFSYAGQDDRLHFYRAEVVPTFWLLTKTADCRIFQEKSVPDIIKEVLNDAGLSSQVQFNLSGQHLPWEYCVQYRESDYHFLARLMAQEGIFYFFKHEQGKHTLVLGDKKSAYATSSDSKVTFEHNRSRVMNIHDQVAAWEHAYEFRSGKWAHTDYNFTDATTNLLTQTTSRIGLPGADKFEVFDYPGEYLVKKDGEADVKLRMEEEEASYDVVQGESYCRGFSAGHKFTMDKHHVAGEAGKGYVLTSVQHSARLGASYAGGGGGDAFHYSNTFTCIPDSVEFRPPRTTEKPRIHGVQTAVVTGPAGEEIHTDKYGRVKVQFHWDRLGKKDDKSSCWIRCAQFSAGKNWGMMSIPRIGQEVVVTYLEGDPDQPLITGVVYNSDQMPVYPLPDKKTKSGFKSNSSPGGSGFNEMSMDDTTGKEQLFLHAQKDMDVLVQNDQQVTIKNDRHLTVENNLLEKIVKNKDVQIEGNVQEAVKGEVKGKIDKDVHLTIGGSRHEKIAKSGSQEWGMSVDQKIGQNLAVEAGMAVHVKAGMTLVLEAGMQLTLKAGSNFIDISPAGIAISGMPAVLINSGGAAGSGAGCSPTSPTAPQPADPKKADDTAKSGQKSCP